MSDVIKGRSPITGTVQGQWNRGLSIYDLAVQQGFRGTIKDFINSLKAFSPEVGEVTQTEDGITFTITDEKGPHQINLRNGIDITIESTELTDDEGTIITFSDGSTITIPRGVTGPQGTAGTDGREVILFCDREGAIYWRYNTDDDHNWKQLIDLGTLAANKFAAEFESHQLVMVVDELPDVSEALDGVIYILKEEV